MYHGQNLSTYKGKKKEGNGRIFSMDDLQYRRILNVIWAVFTKASYKSFHLMPFKKTWESPITGHEQCVYDELYVLDTWNQAQDDIMKQRRDDECKLERVIAGLMFWSDSTRLTQFRHASAWPVYLFFSNLSKYACANPQSGCCHLITFIPSVSFLVLSFFPYPLLFRSCTEVLIISSSCQSQSRTSYHQSPPRNTTATYWLIANKKLFMLSGEYYLMTISSGLQEWHHHEMLWWDYQESIPQDIYLLSQLSGKVSPFGMHVARVLNSWRVILATIQDKGHCPCPCCLVPKVMFHHTGLIRDLATRLSHARTYLIDKIRLAQQAIYVLSKPLKGSVVETILKDKSLVPTQVRIAIVVSCSSPSNLTMPDRTLFVNDYCLWISSCFQIWW